MDSHKAVHLVILILTTSLFSACQKNHKINHNNVSTWKQVTSWSFKGKMAINTHSSSKSGRINWSVDTKNKITQAKIEAFIGGNWEIIESTDKTTLKSSQNGISESKDTQSLISNELGWDFPWNNLKYWIRGYKENQSIIKHTDLPLSFTDEGWDITFQKWMATPVGMLPKKIKASKDQYTVKLIIYNWDLQ